ncbi:MAG: prepilin peptidase [Candidatus Methanosuratincola verstraetei]|uniref:A24 family peptidase n=2 Tax=Candidatus Methanosuratincola (ex Vanwonterghem et al. 2016) TaxID=1915412 RepID=A0A7J3V0U6_9CREN
MERLNILRKDTSPKGEGLSMIFEIKAVVVGAMLAFASYQDLKTREIDDWVWIVGGAAGAALTLLEAATVDGYPYVLAAFSVAITAALAFGVYYLGLYGGADAKALLAIAVAFPFSPVSQLSPFFPLTVLGNSLLLSILLVPACLVINLAWRLAGKAFFDGISASRARKAAAILTGFRVSPSAAKKVHFNLMEVPDGSGGATLKLFSRVTDEDEVKHIDEGRQYVWVTPAIPMIVFFLAGYLIALDGWDLIFWIVSAIL